MTAMISSIIDSYVKWKQSPVEQSLVSNWTIEYYLYNEKKHIVLERSRKHDKLCSRQLPTLQQNVEQPTVNQKQINACHLEMLSTLLQAFHDLQIESSERFVGLFVDLFTGVCMYKTLMILVVINDDWRIYSARDEAKKAARAKKPKEDATEEWDHFWLLQYYWLFHFAWATATCNVSFWKIYHTDEQASVSSEPCYGVE